MRKDLARPDLGALDWSPAGREASLAAVFAHATGLARDAEAWYAGKRPVKKRWGRILRLLAIVSGAAGALLPVLAEILNSADDVVIAPGWSAVALALAAIFVLVDKFCGFSSGWMRYMATETAIATLRQEFEYAFNERVEAGAEPAELLALAHGLVTAINTAVGDETRNWVADLRGALTESEQLLRGPQP